MNNSGESDSIKPILYGMINQIGEAEDNVIVEDLRGMANHMNSYVKLLHVSNITCDHFIQMQSIPKLVD